MELLPAIFKSISRYLCRSKRNSTSIHSRQLTIKDFSRIFTRIYSQKKTLIPTIHTLGSSRVCIDKEILKDQQDNKGKVMVVAG